MLWQTLGRRNTALVQGTELDLALPGHFRSDESRFDRCESTRVVPMQARCADQIRLHVETLAQL
jgi:hypothetical protein